MVTRFSVNRENAADHSAQKRDNAQQVDPPRNYRVAFLSAVVGGIFTVHAKSRNH